MGDLKLLEIGQFYLIKRCLPDQTTMIYTGENRSQAESLDCLTFSPRLLPWLMRSLARRKWDVVFCHVPVRPLWDRKHGLAHAVAEFVRRLRLVHTLGTYALRGESRCPLVLLDFNDEPNIPPHALPLLDRSHLCFKRELPTDPAKGLLDGAAKPSTGDGLGICQTQPAEAPADLDRRAGRDGATGIADPA